MLLLWYMLALCEGMSCCDVQIFLWFWQEVEFIELFAGAANTWKAVSACSYPACRLDLEYYVERREPVKQNPMDVLSSAGWAKHGRVGLRQS